MIKFKALIKFNNESLRKTAFSSGYRPGFSFNGNYYYQTSGQITLLDKKKLSPGESALAEIIPITREYLGSNFGPGSKFTFYEGKNLIGEGEVKEIIQL
jgi:hypothetical protein